MNIQTKKIPVILDTDPGTDIDDSYAIAYLLNCPELDIKLITCATGDTTMRGDIVKRILIAANRTNIPIAVGKNFKENKILNHLKQYLKYNETAVGKYPDAATEIVKTINNSDEIITIISIAPLTNIADALKLDSSIASKANFVGMCGSIYKGYEGKDGRCAEWNIFCDNEASKLVFNKYPWHSMMIAPLDTCGDLTFDREFLLELQNLNNPILIECLNSHLWWNASIKSGEDNGVPYPSEKFPEKTSPFYDLMAIYLAYSQEYLELEELALIVENGTFVDAEEPVNKVKAAVRYQNRTAFVNHLKNRLCKIQ